MISYCEDCGCKVFSSRCTNCHEELYILDQYCELNMGLPNEESDFMKRVTEQKDDVARIVRNERMKNFWKKFRGKNQN